MKIRLHGTSDEIADVTARLTRILDIVAVSPRYPDRGESGLARVSLEVRR